jgi:metal-responsive CopG/Arc/MetJ family transcriptional regulator
MLYLKPELVDPLFDHIIALQAQDKRLSRNEFVNGVLSRSMVGADPEHSYEGDVDANSPINLPSDLAQRLHDFCQDHWNADESSVASAALEDLLAVESEKEMRLRYPEKMPGDLDALLPRESADKIAAFCQTSGISAVRVLRDAVEIFIRSHERTQSRTFILRLPEELADDFRDFREAHGLSDRDFVVEEALRHYLATELAHDPVTREKFERATGQLSLFTEAKATS